MKLHRIALGLTYLGLVSAASAATLQFDQGFTGGLSTNFANASGTVTNGLDWGIIVDTTGNGLLSSYDQITGSVLTSSTIATDDIFFGGGTTYDSSQGGVFLEGDFTTPGGDGGLGSLVIPAYTDGVAAGMAFQIVWFDQAFGTDGVSAGTFADGSFILPPAADTTPFDGPFVGVDPVRAATGTTFGVIPEPSVALLGALGVLGLIRRRR